MLAVNYTNLRDNMKTYMDKVKFKELKNTIKNQRKTIKATTKSFKNKEALLTIEDRPYLKELIKRLNKGYRISKEGIEGHVTNNQIIISTINELEDLFAAASYNNKKINSRDFSYLREKMERYIKTIYNKANEMDTLINELTLYSKIDSNRIPYNFSTLSVNDYFDDCATDLQIDLEARGVSFDYLNYVDSNVKIIADAEQLKRVINNIVSNSVKYMDKEQKKVHLRVKDVGDFIQIEIEDNGKGIGSKELQYIFDRFYRTDASRNSATGGSGIGLSIVKKIIEEHGGKIWATSKEGTGTIMYFVIRKYQEVPVNE